MGKKELNDNEIEKVSGGIVSDEKRFMLEMIDLIRNNNKFYNEVMDCLDKCSGDPNIEIAKVVSKYIDIDEDE